jgi:predicted MFS family arabinose efflux permease
VGTLVSLVYGIIEAPERGWTDPLILGCFGLAAVLGTLFVAWELRTEDPMLNLRYFRNPRFSVASLGLSMASFALFGAVFATTQYLQDAHGYSALEAGAAMVPAAVGLVIGSGSSVKLSARFGRSAVIPIALLGLAVVMGSTLLWTHDMPYLPIGLWFLALAVSMGWIMGPATSSVMSAVPEEKAGVASAMNDVTRQVAGALGTAVVGSLISSLYASRISSSVESLPEASRVAAEESVGQAHAVASSLPAEQAASLADAASAAFTDALGIGFLAAAGCAITAAVVVRLKLPRDRIQQRTPKAQPRLALEEA